MTTRQLLAAAMALLVAGCDGAPPSVEVTGTVRKGGKPMRNLRVTFVPDALDPGLVVATGLTDQEGKYRMQTSIGNKSWDRVKPAKYRVTLPPRAGTAYYESETTPLRVDVQPPGPVVFDIEIPTKP